MIDLSTSDELIRSDLKVIFCLLFDVLEDEDLNPAKEELKALARQLEYLVIDEG